MALPEILLVAPIMEAVCQDRLAGHQRPLLYLYLGPHHVELYVGQAPLGYMDSWALPQTASKPGARPRPERRQRAKWRKTACCKHASLSSSGNATCVFVDCPKTDLLMSLYCGSDYGRAPFKFTCFGNSYSGNSHVVVAENIEHGSCTGPSRA